MNNLIFTVGLCGLVGGIAGYFGHTQGRDYEGNLRCQESGMEQHFRHDFPGYDPIEESPKDERLYQKLGELREGYLSGDIFEHVAVVRPGLILFEIAGVSQEIAETAFRRASAKIPFNVKTVSRD